MKKKLMSLLMMILIVGAMISLTACSGTNNSESQKNVDLNEKENKEIEKSEEKENNKGKRSNPIEIGETVKWEVKFYSDIDDWDGINGLANVTLNEVYEGDEAIDMLYFGLDSLDDVEDGYTYGVGHMTIELIEGDEDAPYKTSFDIGSVSEDGRKSPSSYTSLSDGYEENDYTDLYPGGSVDIMKAFLIPKDSDYLIEIEENISGVKFFKHK